MDWKVYAKAVVSGLVAAISTLLLLLSGNETLADVTFVEWLIVVLAVASSFGFTYVVPNKRVGVENGN